MDVRHMNESLILDPFLASFQAAFERGDRNVHTKQAESRNVSTVLRVYQAIGAANKEAFLDCCDGDVVLEIVGRPSDPIVGVTAGALRVLVRIVNNFSYFADQKPRIESVTAQGDCVVVIGHETGRYVVTNTFYDGYWIQEFHLREGKILHIRQLSSFLKPW
jgi:ketosteroid isomerase-like protein